MLNFTVEEGMMFHTKKVFGLCLLVSSLVLAQSTQWQTTRDGRRNGYCVLESNKLHIIAYPLHVDVEEEAVIKTEGNVWRGDTRTLEITGNFTLPQGAALRSLLLWNGDQILKAKLKNRFDAEKEYEDVVDREKIIERPRDPALIEKIGPNQYQYKIYPVSINKSRRIRILYSIPVQSTSNGINIEIKTAFTHGPKEIPSQIPLTIEKGASSINNFKLQQGTSKKTVRFDAEYLIETSSLVSQNCYYCTKSQKSIFLIPDTETYNHAYAGTILRGKKAGHYLSISSYLTDELEEKLFQRFITHPYTLEPRIVIGEKTIILDFPQDAVGISAIIKTEKEWDGKIYWTAYDTNGDIGLEYEQQLTIDRISESADALALLWAVAYSQEENLGNLGSVYGFVDDDMSLLALESDVLPLELAAQYEDEGVPILLPEEIIADEDELPVIPEENLIIDYEYGGTSLNGTHSALPDRTSQLSVQILNNKQLLINLPDNFGATVTIALYNLKGQLIQQWSSVPTAHMNVTLTAKKPLNGRYILHIRGAHRSMKKTISVH